MAQAGSSASSVEDYLAELTRRLQKLLGARLAGAWVVGSGALADFGATRSDVDVQAVSQTRLARAELAELAAALSHPALACPVRGLEFVLYPRDDLGLPEGPAFSLNLNTGPGMREHAGYDPRAEPRFWFILDVASARERARALAGLPPAALLPQPPGSLVLSALRDSLNWYRDHDGAEAVLATCRASAWTATGRWLSKGEAGVWAAARFPEAEPVIAKALARRADPGAPGPSPAEVAGVLEPAERLLAAASARARARRRWCQ